MDGLSDAITHNESVRLRSGGSPAEGGRRPISLSFLLCLRASLAYPSHGTVTAAALRLTHRAQIVLAGTWDSASSSYIRQRTLPLPTLQQSASQLAMLRRYGMPARPLKATWPIDLCTASPAPRPDMVC